MDYSLIETIASEARQYGVRTAELRWTRGYVRLMLGNLGAVRWYI